MAQGVVEREAAGARDGQARRRQAEGGGVLVPAGLGEEAVRGVHRRGARHRAGRGRARRRGGQPQRQQCPAARLRQARRDGAGPARRVAHGLHGLAGAREPAPAEPAEQLLRAVGRQDAAGTQAKQQQSEITPVTALHVDSFAHGPRGRRRLLSPPWPASGGGARPRAPFEWRRGEGTGGAPGGGGAGPV